MRYYVQFYKRNAVGAMDIALGSEGVFILDGRTTLTNMVASARHRALLLHVVRPHYEAFRIMRGSRFESAQFVTKHLLSVERPNEPNARGNI